MKDRIGRVIVIGVLFLIIFAVFVFRLFTMQVVDGEKYVKRSTNRVVTRTTVKAARGEILDRNCRPIVRNNMVFTAEINTSGIDDLNATIEKILSIFDKYGEEYLTDFPITTTRPYAFDETVFSSEKAFSDFRAFLDGKEIDSTLPAEDILPLLAKAYGIEGYSVDMTAKIVSVRYSMEHNTVNRFYTFAEDISLATATALRENAAELPGVSVEEAPVRVYTHDYFASHIIGTVGKISAEEYDTLSDEGYAMNDSLGKDGIEKICENVLRGVDGYRYSVRDVTGNTTETGSSLDQDPLKGNDVILTLDMNMQMINEKSLPEIIAALHELNGEESATSGAAVFMDIATGEILSSASYPTYNLGTFNKDFDELSKLPSSPYLNRVVSGVFAPGSTYKMVTAVAGLETGILDSDTSYYCPGVYTYYSDYQPTCFGGTAHGRVTVRTALQKSCNGYFFDAARRMGIDTLDEYCYLLGFGQTTGIELPGEAPGTVASRQARIAKGLAWADGETLLAGIGQSDHSVTPLQLCNYVATVARGGSRLEPHIIKSVRNSETGEIVSETQPKVVSEGAFSERTVSLVLEGMELVTESGGSLYAGFLDFDLTSVAAKTGTAEVTNGLPNSLLVGVAPAEDPQIAFAVVIENGGSGSSAVLSELVKEVLTYYFTGMDSSENIHEQGTLLP